MRLAGLRASIQDLTSQSNSNNRNLLVVCSSVRYSWARTMLHSTNAQELATTTLYLRSEAHVRHQLLNSKFKHGSHLDA